MGKKHNSGNWCPVCDGHGGWDAKSYKKRFREAGDTPQTYIRCVYCGTGNAVHKVVPRETT